MDLEVLSNGLSAQLLLCRGRNGDPEPGRICYSKYSKGNLSRLDVQADRSVRLLFEAPSWSNELGTGYLCVCPRCEWLECVHLPPRGETGCFEWIPWSQSACSSCKDSWSNVVAIIRITGLLPLPDNLPCLRTSDIIKCWNLNCERVLGAVVWNAPMNSFCRDSFLFSLLQDLTYFPFPLAPF